MKTLRRILVVLLAVIMSATCFTACDDKEKTVTVTGKVVSEGLALAGVTVSSSADGASYKTVTTGQDGKFQITGVDKNKNITITLSAAGYEDKILSVLAEDLAKGGAELGDIEMETVSFNLVLSGKTVSSGQPVAGVAITATDSRGNSYATVTSGADGSFSIAEVSKTRAVTVVFLKEGYFKKEVALSIQDLSDGKNVMGSVELDAPSAYEDISGRMTALDGISPISGVKIDIEGFEISATSNADGSFTLADCPIGSSGFSVKASKFGYAERFYNFTAEQVATKNLGDLTIGNSIASIDGSIATDFSIIRNDDHLKIVGKFDRPLEGAFVQDVQFHIHVGDNANGTVYNAIMLAETTLFGTNHKMFTRKVSNLAAFDDPNWTDTDVDKHTYTINAEKTEFEYKLYYSAIGMADKNETIGVAVFCPLLNAAQNAWVYARFGNGLPASGNNVFNYSMLYNFDKDDNYSIREYSALAVSGRVTDGTAAVAGAKVKLESTNPAESYPEVTTDSEGKFSIPNVSRYYSAVLKVTKTGYVNANKNISVADLQNNTVEVSDIVLSEISTTETLTGTVANIAGESLAGVKVSAVSYSIEATTDSSGAFTLANVPTDADFELEFSYGAYKTIRISYDCEAVKNEPNVGVVEMFYEFAGSTQIIQFAVKREETGLKYVVRTPTTFIDREMMWLEMHIGDSATGQVIATGLLGKGTIMSDIFGSDKPKFKKAANDAAWGLMETHADLTREDYLLGSIYTVNYSYAELGMQKDDTIGFALVAIAYEGNAGFMTGEINADPSMLALNQFMDFAADGSFTARPQA